jgi:hypothetical protein
LARIRVMWVFTVGSARYNSAPISAFDSPRAIALSTSTSRGVNPARAGGRLSPGGRVLLAATFALLAAVLTGRAERIDRGSRWIRAVRRLVQADLAVLALIFTGGLWADRHPDTTVYQAWELTGGPSFALMFLAGVVLGVCLLHRRDLRTAALLTAAPVVLLPLTIAVQALAPGWAHPAYAETALYLGLALLGMQPISEHRLNTLTPVPDGTRTGASM